MKSKRMKGWNVILTQLLFLLYVFLAFLALLGFIIKMPTVCKPQSKDLFKFTVITLKFAENVKGIL